MVFEKIQDLNPEKSPDGWHPILLKKCCVPDQHTSILFQKSLNKNLVPWLDVCITAIQVDAPQKPYEICKCYIFSGEYRIHYFFWRI